MVNELKIKPILHRYGSNAWDINTIDDLADNQCDLVLCSLWMTEDRYHHFDVTKYFDYQCGTYLVPKPNIINAALYIYLPLSNSVWLGIFISFILTGICVTALSRVNQRHRKQSFENLSTMVSSNLIYSSIARSYLEMFSSTTAHSIHKMPSQTSIKFLLMG